MDIQTLEFLTFTVEAGEETFIVVDGYDQAEGSYALLVDCSCPPRFLSLACGFEPCAGAKTPA